MKKRALVSAVGVAMGGAALVISTQGSAQAAPVAPAAETAASSSATGKDGQEPKVIGSVAKAAGKAAKAVGKAAGKAVVHGKAASGSGASNYGLIGSLYGVAPQKVASDPAVASDTAFDK